MKVSFKCKYCEYKSFFKTEDTIVKATASEKANQKDTYFPKCNNCGKKNPIRV